MKTCLVVDDSSVIRKVARRILEGLEFEIAEAEKRRGSARGLPPQAAGRDSARLEHAENGRLFCTKTTWRISRGRFTPAPTNLMKPFDKEIVEAKFQEVGLV
jgi:two-component system, chemotaxis family, chemotaxis protein CheY